MVVELVQEMQPLLLEQAEQVVVEQEMPLQDQQLQALQTQVVVEVELDMSQDQAPMVRLVDLV